MSFIEWIITSYRRSNRGITRIRAHSQQQKQCTQKLKFEVNVEFMSLLICHTIPAALSLYVIYPSDVFGKICMTRVLFCHKY